MTAQSPTSPDPGEMAEPRIRSPSPGSQLHALAEDATWRDPEPACGQVIRDDRRDWRVVDAAAYPDDRRCNEEGCR